MKGNFTRKSFDLLLLITRNAILVTCCYFEPNTCSLVWLVLHPTRVRADKQRSRS